MIRSVLLLSFVAVVYCQYPEQRAPPLRHQPVPEDYDDGGYAPPPRRQASAPPQPAFRPNPRTADVYRPAPVHYVNIGLELAGDYKFGYDTGKGNEGQSFREETRLPDGSVQGAYGYVDETGTQRIVKYTAGKDGFKVEQDGAAKNSPRSAPAPAPQPTYRPAPAPQPSYRPAPAPQPAYRPPPQPSYAPQPQAAPQPQPAYRPPPPAQPAYRAPEPAYAPAPRPRPQARPAQRRPVESYDEPDYDYPNNEITERRLVPVDTSLFNYNIGTSHNSRN